MKRFVLIILSILISMIVIGCNRSVSYDAYEELIKNLENMSYRVETEDAEKSILSGQRKLLTLNGNENISVYLYNCWSTICRQN